MQVPQKYKDLYANSGLSDHRQTYLGMVSEVDDSIGQVVAALKAKGMYENSVIVFQSDVSTVCRFHGEQNI